MRERADASGGAPLVAAVVCARPPRGFEPEEPLKSMAGPLEGAVRSLVAAGVDVEIYTLERRADPPADAAPIRRFGFDGDAKKLLSTLREAISGGRVHRLIAGPASDALARDAIALAPERGCLWLGLTEPPDPRDAEMAAAARRAKALLYGGVIEKRAMVAAFGAALSRAKMETPPLYGMAPRRYQTAPARKPGVHPYLAHLGPLAEGPLKDWFPKLRDAMAFTHGPLDLYLLGGEVSVGAVGMRAVGRLEQPERNALAADALAVLDLAGGALAGRRMVDAWRLGAPAIVSLSNWPVGEEMALAGGGVAVADYPEFEEAVGRLREPEARREAAEAGRAHAARIADPDHFQRALLALLEV